VELEQPLELPAAVMIRPSEAGPWLTTGIKVLIAGYGQADPERALSSGIKHHGESIIGEVGSSEFWLEHNDNMSQRCHGDSGGPVWVNTNPAQGEEWKLIGIASRSNQDCTQGSIETRVDTYLEWIHQHISIPCGSGLSPDCVSGCSLVQGPPVSTISNLFILVLMLLTCYIGNCLLKRPQIISNRK
jgi:hypothetical protein